MDARMDGWMEGRDGKGKCGWINGWMNSNVDR